MSETLKAISDPIRRNILGLLKEEKKSAGDIAAEFHLTGATVSYHLSQLKKAGLIMESKYKNYIYYELNASVFEDGLLVYFFKGIGFMPQMIEFKDLTAYSLNSKHRIELQFNNHTKNIYLVNATSFYEELDKKFNQYKNGQEI